MAAEKTQTICVSQKFYLCRIDGNITGLVMWLLLGVGFDFAQGDRRVYPSFFQINPKEFVQSEGLVQLLLHFHWNWVGLMANQDEGGERFVSSLVPMLKKKEICLAFTEMMKSDFSDVPYTKLNHIFNTWSKGEVIILYGDSSTFAYVQKMVFAYETRGNTSFLKVWIFTSNWKLKVLKSQNLLKFIKPLHGALHFRDHTRDVSEFSHFLLSLDPLNPQEDTFLPLFWELVTESKNWKPFDEKVVLQVFTFRMTGLPFLLLLLLFWLLTPMAAEKTQTICVLQKGLTLQNRWEYYRPGDVVIGGNLPLAAVMRSTLLDFQNHPLRHIYNQSKGIVQSEGLVQLLLHFHWNWVGLMANQDEVGKAFVSSLVPMLKKRRSAWPLLK
ncbi:hypothetical protein E2320_022194 [Naja naja]|nr:hypothetical protein E2320_022194 [Naja naja]